MIMVKKVLWAVIAAVTLSLLGCSALDGGPGGSALEAPDTEPGITGYVMDISDDSMLVVDPSAQDFSSTGGNDEFYDAIRFSDIPDHIELGDHVSVWYDLMLDSYPGQAEAVHVEVIPSQSPDGAAMTESEVLNQVLQAHQAEIAELVVVSSITYDNDQDLWEVVLNGVWDDEVYTFDIADPQ
jgi:hypothetical protein